MIQIENLTKTYGSAPDAPHALDDVSIDVADGDIIGIIGMSGAGKSTLVRCINLLERPDSGRILVDGQDVTGLTGAALRAYRPSRGDDLPELWPSRPEDGARQRVLPVQGGDRSRHGGEPRARTGAAGHGGPARPRRLLPQPALRRPAAARGHRPRARLRPPSTSSATRPPAPSTRRAPTPSSSSCARINRETGVTIIVITHSMGVVEKICRNVVVLEHGHVVERGSVADVFADPQSQAAKVLLERVDWDA